MSINESNRVFGGEKMLRHMDRIAAWQRGELPPPVTVELDLTNLCNHACPDCSFSYLVNVSKDSLPYDLAARVVAELAAFGVRGLTFSGGGEPLVYGPGRVLSLIEQARGMVLDVGLITNGSLLRDWRFLDLCEWIRVSLDGYDAETFARFHGRNDKEFAKVVQNLRTLCARRPRRATLGVGFLTDEVSVSRRDFWRMAEFCAQIDGLDYLQFRPLVRNMVADPSLSGGYAGFSEADRAGILAAYHQARGFARPNFKVLLSAGKYEALAQAGFGRQYNRCLGHFLEAVVSADAKVYICCHTQGQERFCLGDLKQSTFAEIWHSQRAQEVYESFDPRQTCPPACRLHLQNSLLHELQQTEHKNFI